MRLFYFKITDELGNVWEGATTDRYSQVFVGGLKTFKHFPVNGHFIYDYLDDWCKLSGFSLEQYIIDINTDKEIFIENVEKY